jgi:hypothetical protein
MEPRELKSESFSQYPTEAQKLAAANLDVLRAMPLTLLPLVLRQLVRYDWSFPAEQQQLKSQFDWLKQRGAAALSAVMAPFAAIPLSSELRRGDWLNHPQRFSEQMTAELWSTNRIDAYHAAAQKYQQDLDRAFDPTVPGIPRLTIVIVDKNTQPDRIVLFRKLMPHGTLFTHVDPAQGLEEISKMFSARARKQPQKYAHWYIDGGELHQGLRSSDGVTTTSYGQLVPAALREFALMKKLTSSGTVGVETVTSYVAGLSPDDLGLKGTAADATLRYFETSLLTEGAGCQIFSTTFVQWAARECLRRAQPLTLLARYSTRQTLAPMEQLLSRDPRQQAQDAEGSLVDADMGAYYTWIYQSRLAGADQSSFLAWSEGGNTAIAIAPSIPRGKTSATACNIKQLLEWIS